MVLPIVQPAMADRPTFRRMLSAILRRLKRDAGLEVSVDRSSVGTIP